MASTLRGVGVLDKAVVEVVRDRPVVGQQPGCRDDSLRHACDPRHDRGRVRRRDDASRSNTGPAGDLAAAEPARHVRGGRTARPPRTSREGSQNRSSRRRRRPVAERHHRHAGQVAAGEQLSAGVIAHQAARSSTRARTAVEAVVLDQRWIRPTRALSVPAHLEPQVRLVRGPARLGRSPGVAPRASRR